MIQNLRQIRYHVATDIGEQIRLRHKWTILIVNNPREIDRIRGKTLSQLSPSDDYCELAKGLISNSEGLHYLAYTLNSEVGMLGSEAWNRIYAAPQQIRKDRNLGNISGEPDVWIPEYVEKIFERG